MKGILLILSLLFCSNCFALLTVGEYILLNKQIDDSEKPDKTDLKKYYESGFLWERARRRNSNDECFCEISTWETRILFPN